MTFNPNISLAPEQVKLLSELQKSLTSEQIFWVAGYFAGISSQIGLEAKNSQKITTPAVEKTVTILYGSRTGNGESLAKTAQKIAVESGFSAKLQSMENYPTRELKNERNLLIIVSTHGDGEPSFQAKEFYDFIHSKRAPKLDQLNYSVLALGDRSYPKFCKVGIDVDHQLEALGAHRNYERVDCDVDFRQAAQGWIKAALQTFGSNDVSGLPSSLAETVTENSIFNKQNPFLASVLDKTFLHGRGSDRQTLHVELSLEGSGLQYEPGDSLGVYPTNSEELVDKLLTLLRFDSSTEVQTSLGKESLRQLLIEKYELTSISANLILQIINLTQHEELKALATSAPKMKKFVYGKDLVDFFTLYPVELTPEQFIGLLPTIQPRLYFIASSPLTHPDEVHLTIAVAKSKNNDRNKTGLCSSFLSDSVGENEKVAVFIEKNNNFQLPEDASAPIIMVGAGIGIAPFRAFVEHRAESENFGKSWLFFGNRNFENEFLYQLEWQRFLKTGVLSKMSVAFSRDSEKKIYVQDRMLENGKELFAGLQDGAHLYVCGDMKKMAAAVHQTLLQIIQTEGNLSAEQTEEYVLNLQKSRRYQTDVY